MAYKRHDRPPADHPGGRQEAQRHLPLLHRRLRLQGLHLAREQAGRHGRRPRTSSASIWPSSSPPRPTPGTRPSMYNVVKQDGQDVHIVIKPDKDCDVNSGLGSIRGARMAEMSYSTARATQQQRLTDPMVWRYGQMQPTSWDDALDLVARVTAAVIKEPGARTTSSSPPSTMAAPAAATRTPGAPASSISSAMKVKNIRIHNRPAYNSEVHATRDMGVGELNNCYEDAELCRHHRAGRHQSPRDADQLLPQPLDPEPARHVAGQEAGSSCRASRMQPRASSSSIRGAPSRWPPARPRPARTMSCTSPSNPAPTWPCSTRC